MVASFAELILIATLPCSRAMYVFMLSLVFFANEISKYQAVVSSYVVPVLTKILYSTAELDVLDKKILLIIEVVLEGTV